MLLNIAKIKAFWTRLLHQAESPSQIAGGFALGFFVSFLPVPGLQTLLGLLLAWAFRSNKVACLTGLHLHLIVFPVIPLVFVAEYDIGRYLFHIRQPLVDPESFNLLSLLHQGWGHFRAILIGSLVLGLPSALASYWIVKLAATRWQEERRKRNNGNDSIPTADQPKDSPPVQAAANPKV